MLPFHLPAELVLCVVELAAWDEVDNDCGWVARLCLVCRTIRDVVMVPLYDTVHIHANNFASVIWTASLNHTPFQRTRRALWAPLSGITDQTLRRALEKNLFPAFANAEYFSVSTSMLFALATAGYVQPLQCPMVFVRDVLSDADCDALRPFLDTCTHLHIVLHLAPSGRFGWPLPDVRRLLGRRTTYLVVNTIAPDDTPTVHMEQMVEMLFSLPCARILLCTQEIDKTRVLQFCGLVRKIAHDRGDTRLWIDDSPKNPHRDEFEVEFDLARRGRELWDAGRPCYVPTNS